MTGEEFWYFLVGLAIILFIAQHIRRKDDY